MQIGIFPENIILEFPQEEKEVTLYFDAPHTEMVITNKSKEVCVPSADDFGKIKGDSMIPMMFENNTFLIERYKGQEIKVGQIIRFNYFGQETVHQVIEIKEGKYLTKGIGNSREDFYWIEEDDILEIVLGTLYT